MITVWLIMLCVGLGNGAPSGNYSLPIEVVVRDVETPATNWTDEKLPVFLNIAFDVEDREVRLKLMKHNRLTRDFSVTFAGSQDRVPLVPLEDVAFYKDATAVASVAVTAVKMGEQYQRSLEGTFVLDNEIYKLEPVPSHKRSVVDDASLHVVYHLMKDASATALDAHLIPEIPAGLPFTMDHYAKGRYARHQSRSTPVIYDVETRFVLDFTIWEYWMEKENQIEADALRQIRITYTQGINWVDAAYGTIDPAVSGIGINIWLKEIHIAKTKADSPWVTGDSIVTEWPTHPSTRINVYQVIKKLGMWAAERHWKTADTNVLFTRYSCDYLGLAYVGGVCQPNYAAAVVLESTWMPVWETVAHEIGHNLGAEHDDGACAETAAIMHPWQSASTFSSCSANDFKSLLSDRFPPVVCVTNRVCNHETEAEQACQGDAQCMAALADNGVPDETCQETSLAEPVPAGCENQLTTCDQDIARNPWYCLYLTCCRTCHEVGYGSYYHT